MGVDELAEELYALPPGDFIAARDRAAAAAPRGERGAIRALRRPSLAAWAVNLLVREDPSRTESLLRLGAELRTAHQQPSGAGRLRELIGQQRQLVAALARRAGQLTADAGRPVSDAVLREVEDTVHAALADPDAARQLARGRLTKPFPPPAGFGVLPEATVHQLRPPSAGPAARRPASGRRAAGGGPGAHRTAADGAGGEADGAESPERRASVTDITERARAQERAERERRRRLRQARGEADDLARAARGSAAEATAAERELADARQRLREAREQVHGLTEELRRAKRSLSAAERAERAARGPAQRARQAAERDRKRAEAARVEADRLAPDPAPRPGRRGRRRPGASP